MNKEKLLRLYQELFNIQEIILYTFRTFILFVVYCMLCPYNFFKIVITLPWLVGMNFCPVLPGSRTCYKLLINYILRLHVKNFIPARWDHSFVLLGSRFAGIKFSHLIASACLSEMNK